ncbi:hypothetical protein [Alkalihalobacillus trypoxylicola]|uniref:Core-binding (CB) domain-containing protein n=1 Tax=Alkalihalobacillus trypoxylicola TaxID=519424 RepID=A0A162EIW6_9BACI|nr:hypothetical protein [Alkalihalobacillus trypoxylicola]KYG33016.1 hypothetical protein AZF04_17810 [Alkalihalobacillus trypoxylicola]
MDTYIKTGVKKSTVRIREKELNVLSKYLAAAPIASINYSIYQKLINKLDDDYARTTIKGIHSTARIIFKFAISVKKIQPVILLLR